MKHDRPSTLPQTLSVWTQTRKLKATAFLDPEPFTALEITNTSPPRTMLHIAVGERLIRADVSTRSVRRALAALSEHGTDAVMLTLQGSLAGDQLQEGRLAIHPCPKWC